MHISSRKESIKKLNNTGKQIGHWLWLVRCSDRTQRFTTTNLLRIRHQEGIYFTDRTHESHQFIRPKTQTNTSKENIANFMHTKVICITLQSFHYNRVLNLDRTKIKQKKQKQRKNCKTNTTMKGKSKANHKVVIWTRHGNSTHCPNA